MAAEFYGTEPNQQPYSRLPTWLGKVANRDPTSSSCDSTMTGVHQTMSDRLVAATKCDQYLNVRIFLPTFASWRLCVRFFFWRLGVRFLVPSGVLA
jgi:hypothetical protein